MAQLSNEEVCGTQDVFFRDLEVFALDPARRWDPLRGKGLDLLDGVVGRVDKELPDQMQTLVVGDVRCRLLCPRLTVQILGPLAKR